MTGVQTCALPIWIIFSIIGVFGIFSPFSFSIYLIEVLAAFLFINGIRNLAKGVELRENREVNSGLFIFLSILEIIASLSLMITPFSSQIFMIIYIGFIILAKGIFILVNSLFHKKAFPSLANLNFGNGVIDIIFGILLIGLPLLSQQFIFLCIAWYILFNGANLIITAFTLKNYKF